MHVMRKIKSCENLQIIYKIGPLNKVYKLKVQRGDFNENKVKKYLGSGDLKNLGMICQQGILKGEVSLYC